MDGKKQQLKAQLEELQGKLKEATGNARMEIQDQIDDLRHRMRS